MYTMVVKSVYADFIQTFNSKFVETTEPILLKLGIHVQYIKVQKVSLSISTRRT